jgi:kinesin family protein 11
MAHLDTQLQSLDDIVSQIREQNNTHHAAHTTSLADLSSTVQESYSSIGEHLSSSFERVQSLEADVSAQAGTLRNTLPTLGAEADIRAPLHELRENIGSQNLIEYNPTGETPQRVSYQIPSNLPRTEAHENLLSRLRDRPATSDNTNRSPSKQPIFNDATNALPSPSDMFKLSTAKPIFARSVSASSHAHTITLGTTSLRELDVNIVAQESHTQPLPLVSQSSDSMVMAAPPNKKQRNNPDDGSKLPMKKMRKTVAGGMADRENLSITNFANSVGPGVAGIRRLRSHGSQ